MKESEDNRPNTPTFPRPSLPRTSSDLNRFRPDSPGTHRGPLIVAGIANANRILVEGVEERRVICLRRIPGGLIGIQFRPEHLRTTDVFGK